MKAYCEKIRNEQEEEYYQLGYKAGYDKALAQLVDMTEECKQMGRREVVEWLEQENDKNPQVLDGSFIIAKINKERWQVRKKGWRIK